jgi:hypothetical protein
MRIIPIKLSWETGKPVLEGNLRSLEGVESDVTLIHAPDPEESLTAEFISKLPFPIRKRIRDLENLMDPKGWVQDLADCLQERLRLKRRIDELECQILDRLS